MRRRGFTLVEVLVALVIVAAGAAAVLSSLNTAAASTVYLRDKTFAGWIAQNRIAETRLQTTPPANGKTEGENRLCGAALALAPGDHQRRDPRHPAHRRERAAGGARGADG